MKHLLISFSGGLTSAFMTWFLMNYLKYKDYKKHIVFANTGKERKETLDFINKCDNELGFNTVWLEAITNQEKGKGINFKIVDYKTACTDGSLFDEHLQKNGLPSMGVNHCTRDLKQRLIDKYMKSVCDTWVKAIGIRYDEHINGGGRRGKANKCERGMNIIYPLAQDIKATKSSVNLWWKNQKFTLQLDEHEGNCDLCWKKSQRKKATLIMEGKTNWEWWSEWEKKTGLIWDRDGKTSILDLIEMSKGKNFKPWRKDMQTSIFELDLDIELECLCKT